MKMKINFHMLLCKQKHELSHMKIADADCQEARGSRSSDFLEILATCPLVIQLKIVTPYLVLYFEMSQISNALQNSSLNFRAGESTSRHFK